MNLFYDLRLGYLVKTPGLDESLDTLEFKAGDGEEVVLQFGRSPDSTGPSSISTEPTWTAENLNGSATITIGIKNEDDYSDGDLLASSSTFTNDTDAKTYTFDLDFNTTEIDTALNRNDEDDTNDTASLTNCNFEVTFKATGGSKPRSSKLPILATIYHDVISGDEGTPTNAGDPTEYPLKTEVVQFYPTISSLTGGTAADFDSIATTSYSAGRGACFFDDDTSSVFRVYEFVAGTDAESAPDVIRPDDYATSTHEFVWKLRLSVPGGTPLEADASVAGTGIQELLGLNLTDAATLTLSTGAAARSQSYHTVAAESGTADDLTSITSGAQGDFLFIQADTGDTITIKHNTGSNQFHLSAEADLAISGNDVVPFIHNGTLWCEIGNAAASGAGGISNVVEDTTPQAGGDFDMNSNVFIESVGTAVASATNLAITATGNTFSVTGSTGPISNIDSGAAFSVGSRIKLVFASTPTINESANLVNLTGGNITVEAGDIAYYQKTASTVWTMENYARKSGEALVGGITEVADDTSPTAGGSFSMGTFNFQEAIGTSLASASNLALTATGNTFSVTGSTGPITTIDTGAVFSVGQVVRLVFASTPTINHSANIVNLTSGNITAAAGDSAVLQKTASGVWTMRDYVRKDGSALVGTASTSAETIRLSVTQASHGLSALDFVERDTSGNWTTTFTNNERLRGVVTTVTDANTFTVTLRGSATGFTSMGSYIGKPVFRANSANSWTTTWGRYQMGWITAADTIFVSPTFRPAGTVIYRTPADSSQYDPSAAQELTTTHADINGSNITYTPLGSSTTTAVRYKARFLVASSITSSGLLAHFKLLLNGTLQTESETSFYSGSTTGGEGFFPFDYVATTWSGSQIIKMQGRELNSTYASKVHETAHWDGAAGVKTRRAIFEIEEILL